MLWHQANSGCPASPTFFALHKKKIALQKMNFYYYTIPKRVFLFCKKNKKS